MFFCVYFVRHLYTRCEMFSVVRTYYDSSTLSDATCSILYTYFLCCRVHWKLTLINHGVSGVWSMDLIAKTWVIYTTGISKDLTETRTVSYGDLFYSRWTWWRRAVSQGGLLYGRYDRTEAGAVSQGGLLYGSMDRTDARAVPQGGLL